jgi:hypothetical protein
MAQKNAFTAEHCRQITWAIINSGGAHFDNVKMTVDFKFKGPNEPMFPQSCLIDIRCLYLQVFGMAMKMGCTMANLDLFVAIHCTASKEFVTTGFWGTTPQETRARLLTLLGGAAPQEL